MDSLGNWIAKSRKEKNLTQEELADLANVNLRTIQRMENNENSPRPDTLDLVCKALGMDVSQIPKGSPQETITTNYLDVILDYIFLIVIYLTLMGIVGYMTLDSNASLNSLFAGLLLSFFIPVYL